MIFGFFTSVIPYIIAAGIYLVYIVLSFLQPSVEGIPEAKIISESKTISTPEINDYQDVEKLYNFEESKTYDNHVSFNSGAPFFYEYQDPFTDSLGKSPPEYSIPRQFEYSVKILSDLFFRPPPMC